MDAATVSIGVAFREPDRRLVIAAHPKKLGRFIAGAVYGKPTAIKRFNLKISAV